MIYQQAIKYLRDVTGHYFASDEGVAEVGKGKHWSIEVLALSCDCRLLHTSIVRDLVILP